MVKTVLYLEQYPSITYNDIVRKSNYIVLLPELDGVGPVDNRPSTD